MFFVFFYTHGEYLCIIYGLNAINTEKMFNNYKKYKNIFVNCETKKVKKETNPSKPWRNG